MGNIVEDRRVRVAFETLGCKLNQAETELMCRQLAEAGCEIVTQDEEADIYLLNTCTVTHIADRKSRHLLRLIKRKHPEAKIIAIGCYAQRASNELSEIEGVNLVIGNTEKEDLVQILERSGFLRPIKPLLDTLPNTRTRSFIKIQDGCNNFCAYCIVPIVRGREKSISPDQISREINLRFADGYKEVVLTGTEIGKYEYDDLKLNGLIKRVLNETQIQRLRLSSLQPQEISPDLLDLWQDPRLCAHFHLSLQSGSDYILSKMNRCYNTKSYRDAVNQIRTRIENVAITTDVIVGFPGETGKEFQRSYDFCREIEFARIHVFSYSNRENTTAAVMPEQLEASVKKERSDKMLDLAETSQTNFQRRFIGEIQLVLFEQSTKGICSGVTANYIKVYTKSSHDLTNNVVPIKLIQIGRNGMWGELVE